MRTKRTLRLFSALLLSPLAALHAADNFLVEDGQPRAEIVISDKPQRSARLAAQELQDQIVKISGARLPIVTQPTGKAVKIFVGASAQSPIKADGMQHGAYRIATGADWMALILRDPRPSRPRNQSPLRAPPTQSRQLGRAGARITECLHRITGSGGP